MMMARGAATGRATKTGMTMVTMAASRTNMDMAYPVKESIWQEYYIFLYYCCIDIINIFVFYWLFYLLEQNQSSRALSSMFWSTLGCPQVAVREAPGYPVVL
jgi:predicted permease